MSTEKVRKSMTFDRKLFFSIGSLFIVFIAIILLFEYNLEKENRQQSLNALLQDYNELIYSQIKNKEIDQISIDSIIQSITRKPLRVTIISAHSGKVLLESQQEKEPDSLANNHLDRPEIKSSLKNGNGYAIRYSQSFKKISSIQLNDMTIGSYAPHFLSNGRNFPYSVPITNSYISC